jgi:hypothetical protein
VLESMCGSICKYVTLNMRAQGECVIVRVRVCVHGHMRGSV